MNHIHGKIFTLANIVKETKESWTTSNGEKPLEPEIAEFLTCLSIDPLRTQVDSHSVLEDLHGMVKEDTPNETNNEGFSNLSPEFPWDGGSVWSTMATYFFLLHIPLGWGGLSIVAEVLHQDDLDPQTKAISLLFTQTFELLGAISLIQSTGKPISPSKTFKFFSTKIWAERGWLKASAAGLAIIYIVVLLTSAWQEFFETKGMKNIALEELLTSSVTARCTCFIVYCVITPILEEYVYRWFLLTSLTLYMEWPLAVIVSSCIFSFGHFSIENAIQIFFIGCVLGSAYTWSGNLASSFVIHCVYNFAILMATI